MSASSSIIEPLRHTPTTNTIKDDHHISLVDAERGVEETEDAEVDDSEAPPVSTTPGPSPMVKKLTRNSSELQQTLKREWTRRKYARYGSDRYNLQIPPDEDPANQPQIGEPATPTQTSYLERGRAKANRLLRRKKAYGTKEHRDTVIDVLYENQRGMFLFGIPKYSSSSLFPTDPNAWQNAHLRTSPVDIRNAQLPDPSWEWAWKSWYVDMSRDVDEEGWEYSFNFPGGTAWHGNHPWFHSFVRRRRWLRMRTRRPAHHHTKEKSHELTADYFTIHSKTLKVGSEIGSSEMGKIHEHTDDEPDVEKMEIADIASLIQALKKASVDREKLVAVRKFIDAGGEELYYLSDRMGEIMRLFIYQSSRRQLLTDLLHRFDRTHTRRQSLRDHIHNDADAQREHDAAARQADNLMQAVKAADEQVKQLEFWSDIKGMAQGGSTLQQTSEGSWDLEKWQGLSPVSGLTADEAFANKQAASEGAPELHRHPEHDLAPDDKDKDKDRDKSSVIAVKHPAGKDSSTETEGGYVTAAESASELQRKSGNLSTKGKARNLDGVDEEEPEEEAVPAIPALRKHQQQTVQIVEPVPEHEDEQRADRKGSGNGRAEGS